MEYKKIVRLLSVIIFSLIMSNSVLGGVVTHAKRMENHRSVFAASQAALQKHREEFPHLQEAANEAYNLHQRTVKDLVAQILLEKHGKGHVPTATEIALATIEAHMRASKKFLINYSDLPPVEHAPEPIADQTQEYLKVLASFYNEENVPHDNETLKEFVRKHVIDSTVGVNGKRQELYHFYQTEVKQMQRQGVDQEFIDQFGKDISALFDEIGTGPVVPGMVLVPTPAASGQDVSRSSSAASSVPMSDEDGKDSPVVFDRNRGGSSPSSSTELDTPDSQRYFSPISREPQESPVASPVQGVSRSSSVASQSEQPDSDEGDLMPSSDSEGDDSDDEDDEGISAHQIYQNIDKNQTMQQQLQEANIIFQKLLERPQYEEDQATIQEMHTDVINMINQAFRNW